MDKSLATLTDALKKIIWQLKPHQNPVSFVLLLGTPAQGKTALLRQSSLEHLTVTTERPADIYYNANGIILELNESWLNERNSLLQHTLKELNRCHRTVRITGILLSVDINALCELESVDITKTIQTHAQLLQRFGQALGRRIDTSLVLTKLDGLAGFSDFYQYEHVSELSKPLGFSLDWGILNDTLANNFRSRFDQLINALEQQVLHKMHPARSSLKRTLIREFPLQLASVRFAIQTLLKLIPPSQCRVQAIYFTSAEQGGISVDRINKKIQHEYALTVPDHFPQSTNYRAYFIEGALHAFQAQTQHHTPRMPRTEQWRMGALASVFGLSIAWVAHHYTSSSHRLDDVSKELLAYDSGTNHQGQEASTLYHLAQASALLETLPSSMASSPALQQLKATVQMSTTTQLNDDFLPAILSVLEQTLLSPQETPVARYNALKIYLMLNEPKKCSQSEVFAWFKQHWQSRESNEQARSMLALLKQIMREPRQPIPINQQLVRDIRNYLNALPMNYLYYSLAKQHFTMDTQPLQFNGFTLGSPTVPVYFTRVGFEHVLNQLPAIAATLETENWVLTRSDLSTLPARLEEAYCDDYVMWWQHFMQKTTLNRAETYQEASQLTQSLEQSNAISQLTAFMQAQTSPNFTEQASVFNRAIASQFTALNLISHSAIRDLSRTIHELQPFLMTLAVVNDQGRSAFMLSKARFEGEGFRNPLTALYSEAKQFPEPIASWTKHLADDTWFLIMNDTKQFINTQWNQTVFQTYQNTISNRYPFDSAQTEDVSMADFNHFFSSHGVVSTFVEQYLKPFLDTSQPQWQLKEADTYVLPISPDMLAELIRANVITAMFFPGQRDSSQIEFSLQKLNLDPIIAHLTLSIGEKTLADTQTSESFAHFQWPGSHAKLILSSIEGNDYQLEEQGPWAFFKMLQKVNVLVDEQDSASLQILFEINGNSGRYQLKTQNPLNPFTPGILNGFTLTDAIATA